MENQLEEYIVNGKKILVNLFESIRDANDAYFVGYLFADGAYHQPTNTRKERISVSSTDVEIIDYFITKYQPMSDICTRSGNCNQSLNIIGKRSYKNLILSSKFSPFLNKFGVMRLKQNRIYHNIPKQYFMPFLLGIFDGDGSISWGKRKDRDRLWADFKITHPSLKLLIKIQTYLHQVYGITSFTVPKGNGEKCFVLRVSNRHTVAAIFELLYSVPVEMKNERKYHNYENFYNTFKANAT